MRGRATNATWHTSYDNMFQFRNAEHAQTEMTKLQRHMQLRVKLLQYNANASSMRWRLCFFTRNQNSIFSRNSLCKEEASSFTFLFSLLHASLRNNWTSFQTVACKVEKSSRQDTTSLLKRTNSSWCSTIFVDMVDKMLTMVGMLILASSSVNNKTPLENNKTPLKNKGCASHRDTNPEPTQESIGITWNQGRNQWLTHSS